MLRAPSALDTNTSSCMVISELQGLLILGNKLIISGRTAILSQIHTILHTEKLAHV